MWKETRSASSDLHALRLRHNYHQCSDFSTAALRKLCVGLWEWGIYPLDAEATLGTEVTLEVDGVEPKVEGGVIQSISSRGYCCETKHW